MVPRKNIFCTVKTYNVIIADNMFLNLCWQELIQATWNSRIPQSIAHHSRNADIYLNMLK